MSWKLFETQANHAKPGPKPFDFQASRRSDELNNALCQYLEPQVLL